MVNLFWRINCGNTITSIDFCTHKIIQILKMKSKFVRTVTIGSLLWIVWSYKFNNAVLSPGESFGTNLQFLFPFLPYVPSNLGTMASFFQITPGEVHGEVKQRDDYTASRRAGTMYCCVAVGFNVLPAQRVSFDVLPTQRVYPWDYISDGFVLPQDNQFRRIRGEFRCATSTGSSFLIDLSHGHHGSYDETTATIRRQTRDLSPPLMLNDVTTTWDDDGDRRGVLVVDQNDGDDGGVGLGIGLRRRAEQGQRPISTSDLA